MIPRREDVERQVTFLIKTFERPTALRRLLTSARHAYPKSKILVADDSRRPDLNIDAHVFTLPFDSGLSKGRNALLERVETPFFLLLDDDYVFDGGSRVEELLHLLLTTEVDIAGGEWFRWGQPSGFYGLLEREENTLLALPGDRGEIAGCPRYDFIPNLFVGRTESVRQVGWDEDLKLGEHLDFFWRVREHSLSVVLHPRFTMLHEPISSSTYQPYRRRGELEYRQLLMRKYGLERLENRVTGRSWSLLADGRLYAEPADLSSRIPPKPPLRPWWRHRIIGSLRSAQQVVAGGSRRWFRLSPGRYTNIKSRVLPNFLILGAQEAGGETLWNALVESGAVLAPRIPGARIPGAKPRARLPQAELKTRSPPSSPLHFFDRNYWRGERWYRSHFPSINALEGGLLAGEFSPGYLFHPATPFRIASTVPEVKLIVMICDPVRRAQRHYETQRREGNEPSPSFREAVLQEADRVYSEWQRAYWDPYEPSRSLNRFSYIWGGHYADQLRRWLKYFEHEHILVIQWENLIATPAETLRRVRNFLGIEVDINPKRLETPTEVPPLDADLERILRAHYKPRDEQLTELLEVPLAWPV